MATLDNNVLDYYERGGEQDRLEDSLELLRTKVLLDRLLPRGPSNILDVGGAYGVYAGWLAERGHKVRLIDPVPLHVEAARGAGIDAEVGDARSLDEPDDSADVVLMLGPLYHLLDRAERVRALAEARRVVRPGGLVIAAVISRWSPMYEGVLFEWIDSPGFVDMLRDDLTSGTRRGTQNIGYGFTTAYFHRPDDVEGEVTDAGLEFTELLPVEGIAYWMPDIKARLADPASRALLLELIERTEREPSILGATAHLLAVARR